MTTERLVFLPGLLCDAAVWADQQAGLADRAQSFVAQYHDLDSIEAMAAKVLRDAPYAVFSLAGHSMGGRVALEIVRQAPQRVRRLALLDTGYEARKSGEAGDKEKAGRMHLLRIAQEHGMREMGQSWAPGMVHPERVEEPVFEAILQMIQRRTPVQFEAQITALLNRPDAGPVLRTLSCPAYVLCGRQDAWSPYARHETMHGMIPAGKGTLLAIEDSGHMTPMERPRQVTAALAQWLAQ